MPHALLVVNRRSREGNADLGAGIELLASRGFSLLEFYTADPAAIPGVIRKHRREVELVILGGGDGTLNTAARSVVESGLPLGILPMGTANDLARTLRIPISLREACRVIAAGRKHRIDLGEVNGRYFFNAASIGLAVRVTHQLSPELKARWGVLAYARGLLRALQENRPFAAEIVCNGRSLRHRSIQIAVGNGRHYGGGMTINTRAMIDDHCLNLYSLEPQSLWRLLRLVPDLRRGTAGRRPGVKLVSGREISIRTRHPQPVVTDGELTARTPARFRVVESALSVFVPKEYGRTGGKNANAAQ